MKVQELLDCEDKWTKKVMARNKNEEWVPYDSPSAVKWCLLGAIHECYPLKIIEVRNEVEDAIGTNIGVFNDTHNYQEVMELVKRLDI